MSAHGYVLRDEAFVSDEPQEIAGFPGVWRRGEPVAASVLAYALGIEVDDLDDLVAEREYPLDRVADVEVDEALLAYHGGKYSSASFPSERMGTLPRDASDVPGLSSEEAEERERYRAERDQPEAMRTMIPDEAVASGVRALTLAQIREDVGEMTEAQLEALTGDSRKSVKALVEKERERRAAVGEDGGS